MPARRHRVGIPGLSLQYSRDPQARSEPHLGLVRRVCWGPRPQLPNQELDSRPGAVTLKFQTVENLKLMIIFIIMKCG